jgi:hypothetical protein
MRKIHPGFKALAILLGPATLILAHQKASDYLSRAGAFDPERLHALQQVYATCSKPPRLQRTVQCDEYVRYFERCHVFGSECDVNSIDEVLAKLHLVPVPSNGSAIDRAAARPSPSGGSSPVSDHRVPTHNT